MIKSKDEFYQLLWDNYISYSENEREHSFIAHYFAKRKESRAEIIGRDKKSLKEYATQKKRDKYTLLRGAYLALKNEVISENEYCDILRNVISVKGKVPKKYENIVGREKIDKAQTMFERRFLLGCVNDYFYSLGYRVNKKSEYGESFRIKEQPINDDGYNDEFRMLTAYYLENGTDGENEVVRTLASVDDEYIKKCDSLYNNMLEIGNGKAFVPLYIHPDSGAGVYIIGSENLEECSVKTDKPCYICIINFEMLESVYSFRSDVLANVCMKIKTYPSMSKAFEDFVAISSGYEYFKNYPDENSDFNECKFDEHFTPLFVTAEESQNRYKKIEEDYDGKEKEEVSELKKIDKQRGKK